MTKANLCFIGAGFHASANIYPAAIKAGVGITAIATHSLERSKKALLRFGSRGTPYDDYVEMLKSEKCDGVVVVAPPKDQFLIVLECVKLCKNVFVEKPLGWSETQARIIRETAKNHKALVMIGFMKRFAPCYKKIKDIIDSKELGMPRSFIMNFSVDSTKFCKNEDEFLKLAGIHIIDLVRFLFGEVIEVTGFKNNIDENISQCISLKFESGVIGSIYFSGMTAWSRESENMTVTFDNGFVQTEEISKVIIHSSKLDNEKSFETQTEEDRVFTPSATPASGAYRDLYLRGFIGEFEHFIHCIKNGEEPCSNEKDNICTMALCDNIQNSLK